MRTLQLFTLALLATAARADIITFHDLTSGRTVDGSSRSAECSLQFSTVSNGECKIAALAGTTLNHDFDDTLFILDDPLPAGPDTRISDRFRLVGFGGDTFYTIFFNSFDGTTTCLLWENCLLGYKVTETRSPEFTGAFLPIDFSRPNSNDQSGDIIRFESNTDPIPEPSTLLLLATVTLALLTGRRLRRRRRLLGRDLASSPTPRSSLSSRTLRSSKSPSRGILQGMQLAGNVSHHLRHGAGLERSEGRSSTRTARSASRSAGIG